jgi:hypothetical protein
MAQHFISFSSLPDHPDYYQFAKIKTKNMLFDFPGEILSSTLFQVGDVSIVPSRFSTNSIITLHQIVCSICPECLRCSLVTAPLST